MAATITPVAIPRVRGAKWLREADYISDDVKQRIVDAIQRQRTIVRESYPDALPNAVGIRPAAYIGPDMEAWAIVTFRYRGGESILETVRK